MLPIVIGNCKTISLASFSHSRICHVILSITWSFSFSISLTKFKNSMIALAIAIAWSLVINFLEILE
jgi:hypothetical protein